MQIGGRAACGAPALLCDAYKTLFLPALLLSVEVQNVAGGTAEVIAIKKSGEAARGSPAVFITLKILFRRKAYY